MMNGKFDEGDDDGGDGGSDSYDEENGYHATAVEAYEIGDFGGEIDSDTGN